MLTEEVFLSYGNKWQDVVTVQQSQLDAKPEVTLIRAERDYKVYKIKDGKKYWIETMAAFKRNKFRLDRIAPVNWTELVSYPEGESIK